MNSTRIDTNVVTGFLGVGKTSAILNLIAQRAENERVAVLVNEFGAIGIDGSLFSGQRTTEDGISIAEVPGGCMCCTSGPLTQVALNKLIGSTRPQRLLIELSGLGHPLEVLQLLNSEYYRDVLSLRKTVTLVDARKLKDDRYINHPIFNQQIAIADLVIGNKEDLYDAGEKENLIRYVERVGQPNAEVFFTTQGAVPLFKIDDETAVVVDGVVLGGHNSVSPPREESLIPACGYLCEVNSGEGFETIGWRIDPSWIFSREKVVNFLGRIEAERAKGVFVTDEGVFGYNRSQDEVKEIELDDCLETRLEIIAPERDADWQANLFGCVIQR